MLTHVLPVSFSDALVYLYLWMRLVGKITQCRNMNSDQRQEDNAASLSLNAPQSQIHQRDVRTMHASAEASPGTRPAQTSSRYSLHTSERAWTRPQLCGVLSGARTFPLDSCPTTPAPVCPHHGLISKHTVEHGLFFPRRFVMFIGC